MNDIAPARAFERVLRSWRLMAAMILLGGVAGWIFSLFRRPVYEATAFYSVRIDTQALVLRLGLNPENPLEFPVINTYLTPVAAVFREEETQDQLRSAAQVEGLPAEMIVFDASNFILDRRGSLWFATVRSNDPVLAASLANLWLEVVDARLRGMLSSSFSAEALEAEHSAVVQCFSSLDFAQANECAGTAFQAPAEFEAYIKDLSNRIAVERQASHGLDTTLQIDMDRLAEPPVRPVLYGRATLTFAGSLSGLLLGSLLAQIVRLRPRSGM
jgi:hypothetical protein